MIFTLFMTIVFIAEMIIALTIIISLIRLDKKISDADKFLIDVKPKIQEITKLTRNISEQLVELVPDWVNSFRQARDKFLLSKMESFISSIIFWHLNIKFIKKLRKMRFVRAAIRGLTFLQNMV